MRKFNFLLTSLAFLLIGSSLLKAQNSDNPWYISLGMHAVDHTSVRGVGTGFFDYNDYSIVPPLSKLSVARNLGNSFAVDLTASIGEIDNNRLLIEDEFFINAGLGLRYRLANGYILKQNSWFDPYLRIGANYHKYDYEGIEIGPDNPFLSADDEKLNELLEQEASGKEHHFGISGGLGINFWLTKNFALNVASDYNYMTETSTVDYFDFFQHTVGVAFRFGGNNDKDGDGILDEEDACPETPGVASSVEGCNGCPDADGDGLCDSKDNCPEEAGPVSNQGCPVKVVEKVDSDGDGIYDDVDDCPNTPGVASSAPGCNGCPDKDGDGTCDSQDPCPEDPKDECVLLDEVKDVERVFFEYNSDAITAESKLKLDKAAKVLANKNYSEIYWLIEGHTDSKGSASYNKNLSQRRADSVKNYLSSKGVPANRIKAVGAGEALPIRPNDTDAGRAKNRRVEFIPSDSNFQPKALKLDNKAKQQVLNKLAKKVYFQVGSAKLVETSKVNLARIAAYLKDSDKNWEVAGHTDATGNDANNMTLSQKRAQSVVDFLVSIGVPSSKLTAKGYGESKPIDSNDTKEGRANNRRIEFN